VVTSAIDLHARLRLEVAHFRERERRRTFDPALWVGSVGRHRASVAVPSHRLAMVDRQVGAELFAGLLEEAPDGTDTAWLSRSGPVVVELGDVAAMVAAETAFGSAGRRLAGCYVITREGWVDLRTGERRVWRRLRL
jgi:hypothetical protein